MHASRVHVLGFIDSMRDKIVDYSILRTQESQPRTRFNNHHHPVVNTDAVGHLICSLTTKAVTGTYVRKTLTVARYVTGPRFENLFKLVSLSALEQREIHSVGHALSREEHADELLPKASDVTHCTILQIYVPWNAHH